MQELRVAGALSKCKKMYDTYVLERKYDIGEIEKPKDPNGNYYTDPNVDLHCISGGILNFEVARIIRDEPWLANKNTPVVAEARQDGKILSFSTIYGASEANIAEQIKLSIEEAKKVLIKFFGKDGYWELDVAIKSAGNIAKAQGWVRSACNRVIYVKESNAKGIDNEGSTGRKSFNAKIQGQ